MPDEIAILRATGHEDAAKILEALRAEQTAALPPAAPAAPAAEEQAPGLTKEQLDSMSIEELNACDQSLIDDALRRGV
jgi:hypothetical protein